MSSLSRRRISLIKDDFTFPKGIIFFSGCSQIFLGVLHRGKDSAQGTARAECLNLFLRYSSTVSFHQFPKYFGGNSFRICTYKNNLIHINDASCFYSQLPRWALRWGVLTAEREADFESRGGRTGSKCTLPCCWMPWLRSGSPVSPGCKGFAYEWKCFLVADVEPGNNSPCSDCRATPPFHPRDSVTWGNPQALSLSCVHGTNFSFSTAAVTSLSHPRWGGPQQWTCGQAGKP